MAAPKATMVSDEKSAGRFERPVDAVTIKNAKPSPTMITKPMPSERVLNQLVLDSQNRTPKVDANAAPKTIRTRWMVPPITPDQKIPATMPAPTSQSGSIIGSANQSLKLIDMYCFSRTATQKIGSEKKRNETNVIA